MMTTTTVSSDHDDDAAAAISLLHRTGQFLQRSSVESLGPELLTWYVHFRSNINHRHAAAAKGVPSVRSRLSGVGRIATDCSQVFYDRSRDFWLLLLLLRLHGFTATAVAAATVVHDEDKEVVKRNTVSTVVVMNTGCNVDGNCSSASLVRTVVNIMRDLRRKVSGSVSRRRTLIETADRLEHEIDALRVERDELFTQRNSDDERIAQQSRLIDDLQRSAEFMVGLLSRSEDSIKLLVQQKTVAMERTVTVAEDESRALFERERNIAAARIAEITNERLPKIVQIRHIVSSIEAIVERVRNVISKLTRRLVDLLEHRVRQRQLLEREMRQQQERRNPSQRAADFAPLDKGTVRRVRRVALRLADKRGRELSFRATRELDEYVGSLSYPTIVETADLRETLRLVCDTNARYALMKVIEDRRSPFYTLGSPIWYRSTRSALVAWLYFYATSEWLLDTVELLYDKMLTVYLDQSIDTLYAELPAKDEPPFRAFALMHMDLRLIPADVFYALTRMFRLRCRRMLQMAAASN